MRLTADRSRVLAALRLKTTLADLSGKFAHAGQGIPGQPGEEPEVEGKVQRGGRVLPGQITDDRQSEPPQDVDQPDAVQVFKALVLDRIVTTEDQAVSG
jgi:hypothetical protein